MAMQRSYAYRAELVRNPPPAENIYGSHGGNVYTAMASSATYKAPSEMKTM